MQLTASRKNTAESLEAERATCAQHRAAIAELAEDALAAKVRTHAWSISWTLTIPHN